MSVNEKMTALADAVRAKSGETGKLSIDGMTAAVSNIVTDSGIDTSDAIEITPDDVSEGLVFYNASGRQTGSLPDAVVTETDSSVNITAGRLRNDLNVEKASGGGGGADVTLGRVNSDLNFQPFRFEGTDAFPDGDPVVVDTYYSWNTNGIVIIQSTVTLALEQYVETSIDLSQYVSAERSVSFSADTLPAGLTLNDSVISGYPTVFGDFTVNITASSHGASDKTFILVLNIAETEIVLPDPLFYASFASESATAESGQELTVTGTPEYTTVQGIPCVKFDGTNYMTFPDTGLPAGTSARTMSCWCYVDSFSTYNNPMLLGYGTRASSQFSGIYLESSANYVLFSGYSAANNIQTASNTITTGKWYHIACTKNGENEKIYINGKLAIEGTSGKNTTLGLGQIADTTDSDSYRYDGALAACRIYDSELDSDQITILANEFTPTE